LFGRSQVRWRCQELPNPHWPRTDDQLPPHMGATPATGPTLGTRHPPAMRHIITVTPGIAAALSSPFTLDSPIAICKRSIRGAQISRAPPARTNTADKSAPTVHDCRYAQTLTTCNGPASGFGRFATFRNVRARSAIGAEAVIRSPQCGDRRKKWRALRDRASGPVKRVGGWGDRATPMFQRICHREIRGSVTPGCPLALAPARGQGSWP
jgi:hypothetical protein